jgi:membrane protein implicated in regulation of membrane protease activity
MKQFFLPLVAAAACLPCLLPVLFILTGGIGVFLTTGLLVSGVVVLLGALLLIVLMRRRASACPTPRTERGAGE